MVLFWLNSLFNFKIHESPILEKEEVIQKEELAQESLSVLRDCKRVVELKFQNSLVEKSKLDNRLESAAQQTEMLQVKNHSLEERLASLESEKQEQTNITAEIQQSLVEKTSLYESQIRSMQIELEQRLDEVNLTKVEEESKVRDQYAQLLNEKAAELMGVRQQLEKVEADLVVSQRQICELEYREAELNTSMERLRRPPDSTELIRQTEDKLRVYNQNNELLQSKLSTIHKQFEESKTRESQNVARLSQTIRDLELRLLEKDSVIESQQLCQQGLQPLKHEATNNNIIKRPDLSTSQLSLDAPAQQPHISSSQRTRKRKKKRGQVH